MRPVDNRIQFIKMKAALKNSISILVKFHKQKMQKKTQLPAICSKLE